jgi:hypothetical protein
MSRRRQCRRCGRKARLYHLCVPCFRWAMRTWNTDLLDQGRPT